MTVPALWDVRGIDMELTPDTCRFAVLDLGKIEYSGSNGNINHADVCVGFGIESGDSQTRFMVYGNIWNANGKMLLKSGYGTAKFLLEEFFPMNPALRRAINFAEKWNLASFTEIPDDERNKIIELMEDIEDFNGDLWNL